MREDRRAGQVARRSFLSRIGVGATAFAAAFGTTRADAQSASEAPLVTRHAEDDWFEAPGAKHRMFADTTSSDGFGRGLFFSNNFFTGSQNGYGLKDPDSAIIISARHEATPFTYNDAMWAKYGQELSVRAGNFLDPKTKAIPTVNVYNASGYALGNGGVTVDAMSRRGLRFAVCTLATRAAAGMIARRTGASADDVFKELSANLVPNGRLVPAGVVAVNRSQERGYTLMFVG